MSDPIGTDLDERLAVAFEDWIEAQRAALRTMREADVPRSDTDVAEGYRWITRLTSLAQDWFVEQADPLHPNLFVSQTPFRKLLVDNPDVQYRFAVLDDSHRYRLSGRSGDAPYVGFTFGTPIGKGAVEGRTGTTLQTYLDRFELGPDGEFEILITPAPRPDGVTNWIELVPGTGQLAVRETFFDKRTERASDLVLEMIDDVAPPVLTADELIGKLEFASVFLQFVAATAVNMWSDTSGHVNSFGGQSGSEHVDEQSDEVRSHSDEDMVYHGGRWQLDDGQALVVTVEPPDYEFLYWGLAITNPWMESYDYRYTTTNLNNRTAAASDDGAWRLVIAPTDPGVPNWIDTGGRREGYMLVRWVLAGDRPPHPSAEIVDLAELS